MGFRAKEELHKELVELSKQQNRSLGNVLQLMVLEQLKRVKAGSFDSIFYKAGEQIDEQETTG